MVFYKVDRILFALQLQTRCEYLVAFHFLIMKLSSHSLQIIMKLIRNEVHCSELVLTRHVITYKDILSDESPLRKDPVLLNTYIFIYLHE